MCAACLYCKIIFSVVTVPVISLFGAAFLRRNCNVQLHLLINEKDSSKPVTVSLMFSDSVSHII